MELIVKILNCKKPATFFLKNSVVDVWQEPNYAFELSLSKGNLNKGSREDYFGSVGRQNDKPKSQGRHI